MNIFQTVRDRLNVVRQEVHVRRGAAVVLVGPQGCGKTTLVRELAEARGSFSTIDACRLDSPFDLGRVLADEPPTLIVEDFPETEEAMAAVMDLITEDTTKAHRPMQNPKVVRTPDIIFCIGHVDAIRSVAGDPRFAIVEM